MEIIKYQLVGLNIGCLFSSAIIALLLFISIANKSKNEEVKPTLLLFLGGVLAALWTDLLSYFAAYIWKIGAITSVLCILTYTAEGMSFYFLYLYILNLVENRRGEKFRNYVKYSVLIYVILSCLLYASSAFTNWFYTINEQGFYVVTDKTGLAAVIMLPIFVLNIIAAIVYRRQLMKKEKFIITAHCIIYLLLGAIDNMFVLDLRFVAITIAALTISIWMENDQLIELKNKERELMETELNALRLQMNPHFLYNTLASVDGLCIIDPKEARKLIAKLTKHLRKSYLDNPDLVWDFSRELDSVKSYAEIEQTRFQNLKIIYDIETDEFTLPTHTVQPLLENAIKYGICGRRNSEGTVTITTKETDAAYFIKIADDGVGFDVNSIPEDSGRTRIGIKNVKRRLEILFGGSMEIKSIIGIGTEVVICIPKEVRL